jgi:hypothetical protein
MSCRYWAVIVVAAGLLFNQGCTNGPTQGEIQGRVTLDSKPVEKGIIRLIPTDNRLSPTAANIRQGKFELRLPVATYRVEISWPKLPPETSAAGKFTTDLKEDYIIPELIPAKYNTKSELTFEVKSGLSEPWFELTSR